MAGLEVQSILAGGGLSDGSPAVEILRNRISTEFRVPNQFRDFSLTAAQGNTPEHRALVQDTVNCFGQFLGFKVEFGNYGRNTLRPIEFDGFWQSKTGNAFLIYLKTHEQTKLSVADILHTLKRLNTQRQAAAGIHIFAVIVVCGDSFEEYLHSLPRANLIGRFSILSLKTLFALGDRTLSAGRSFKMMERLMLPVDPLAIDRRMELIDLLLEAGLGGFTQPGMLQAPATEGGPIPGSTGVAGTLIGLNPPPIEQDFPDLSRSAPAPSPPASQGPPSGFGASPLSQYDLQVPGASPISRLDQQAPPSPISRLDQQAPAGPISRLDQQAPRTGLSSRLGQQAPQAGLISRLGQQAPPIQASPSQAPGPQTPGAAPISRLDGFTAPPSAPGRGQRSIPPQAPAADIGHYRQLAETAESEGRASEALQYWESILVTAPEDPVAREGATRARMVTGGGLPPMRPTSSPGLFTGPGGTPPAPATAALQMSPSAPAPVPSPPSASPAAPVPAAPQPAAQAPQVDGRGLLALGKVAQAIPLLEAEAEAAQTDPSLYRDLGLAKGIHGDRDGSQRAFTRCLQLLGNFLPGYREVALAALHSGQTETAEDAVVTYLSNNPDNPMAYILLGEIYGELGRDRDSAEAFENAVNLGPENAVAHCELARALMETGQYPKAEQSLSAAATLDPNLALAHAYRGDLRRLTGDRVGARASYQKAISIDPGSIPARLGNALLQEDNGKQEEAAQMLEDLMQEEPGNRKLQTALLRAQARAGHTERTLELAEYILTYDPRNRSARIFLGISLYNLGDVPRATTVLEGVLEEAVDDPQVLLYLGLCYFTRQRWDESIEALEEATRHDTALVDAYLYLGYGYRNLGNGMDAALNFTKVLNLEPENEAARQGMMSLG